MTGALIIDAMTRASVILLLCSVLAFVYRGIWLFFPHFLFMWVIKDA